MKRLRRSLSRRGNPCQASESRQARAALSRRHGHAVSQGGKRGPIRAWRRQRAAPSAGRSPEDGVEFVGILKVGLRQAHRPAPASRRLRGLGRRNKQVAGRHCRQDRSVRAQIRLVLKDVPGRGGGVRAFIGGNVIRQADNREIQPRGATGLAARFNLLGLACSANSASHAPSRAPVTRRSLPLRGVADGDAIRRATGPRFRLAPDGMAPAGGPPRVGARRAARRPVARRGCPARCSG